VYVRPDPIRRASGLVEGRVDIGSGEGTLAGAPGAETAACYTPRTPSGRKVPAAGRAQDYWLD